ncbi:MAG: hypothetical protein J6U53_05075 [Tidjanibacter sp.]|nr:hypothetical protein [Tidjanibacter sp.]
MKKFQYIFAVALSLTMVGCYDDSGDEWLIESLDPTASGMILFEQSTKALVGASGMLIQALNLNEYILAPDEESRLALEDRYYPYRKVREKEDNLWYIYDDEEQEIYHFNEGLLLGEEGAEWEVVENPMFLYKGTQSEHRPLIQRIGEDCYRVQMRGCEVPYYPLKVGDFDYYLRAWRTFVATKTQVELDVTITTNNTAFRKGEAEALVFTMVGGGKISDDQNNYGDGYVVDFRIADPVTLTFGDNAVIADDCTGVGKLKISNDTVEVTATMSHNAIAIRLFASTSAITGYYDWTGACITPQ